MQLAIGLSLGALAFFAGDSLIDSRGGAERKRSTGEQANGSPLAIVLGTLLDGVPESFIIGLTVVTGGGVSVAFLAAVFLSNLPESMAASHGLDAAGWKRSNTVWMWSALLALSAASSAIGFAVFTAVPTLEGALVQAFAAGALLTMLADTMMPEAFEFSGKAVGLFTVLGFGVTRDLQFGVTSQFQPAPEASAPPRRCVAPGPVGKPGATPWGNLLSSRSP